MASKFIQEKRKIASRKKSNRKRGRLQRKIEERILPKYLTISTVQNYKIYEGLYEKEELITQRILKKKENNNVLLFGEQLQVKDFENKLISKINRKTDLKVFILNVDEFLRKTGIDPYVVVDKLINTLKNEKGILIINNFEKIITEDIWKYMEGVFTMKNIRTIASMDNRHAQVNANLDFFITVYIEECKFADLEKAMYPSLTELIPKGMSITKEARKTCIMFAVTIAQDIVLSNIYDILDEAVVIARNEKSKQITKDHIYEVFRYHFEELKEYNEETLRRIALHEAGHYIVYRSFEKFDAYSIKAISILPGEEGTLGANYLFFEKVNLEDMELVEKTICCELGGRAAEKLFCSSISIGSASDLQQAVREAYEAVTYGLSSDLPNSIAEILSSMHSKNHSTENEIGGANKLTEEIIEQAFENAVKILERDEAILKKLADVLMKEKIILTDDFEKKIKE